MSFSPIPTAEKIGFIERMIAEEPGRTYRNDILKAIAADLRGRLDGAPSVALVSLEQRMVSLSRASGGRRVGVQIGVAEELVARWPTIKQALERFGAEVSA